jgi:hypothetical protein
VYTCERENRFLIFVQKVTMAFEISVEDNYTSIHLNERIGAFDMQALHDQMVGELMDTPYFIMEGSDGFEPTKELIIALKAVNESISTLDGTIVFVGFTKNVNQELEANEMVVIPSFDEAVDYLFMIQLERDLGKDD